MKEITFEELKSKNFTEEELKLNLHNLEWEDIMTYQHISDDFVINILERGFDPKYWEDLGWYGDDSFESYMFRDTFMNERSDMFLCSLSCRRFSKEYIENIWDNRYNLKYYRIKPKEGYNNDLRELLSRILIYQKVSETFIEKNAKYITDNLLWEDVSIFQILSNEFVKEYKKIDEKRWFRRPNMSFTYHKKLAKGKWSASDHEFLFERCFNKNRYLSIWKDRLEVITWNQLLAKYPETSNTREEIDNEFYYDLLHEDLGSIPYEIDIY